MMFNRLVYSSVLLGLLFSAGAKALSITSDIVKPEQADITGTAKNKKGEVIYREFHQVSPSIHRMDYQGADGQWLAHKVIRRADMEAGIDADIDGIVSFDLYYPDRERTTMVNASKGEITIDIKSRKKDIAHKMQYRSGDVVDVGFNQLIQSQWQALQSGKTVTTRFLMFRRGSWIDMSIKKTSKEKCAEKFSGTFDICLTINPMSMFLSLMAPEILLAYGSEKELLMYVGPSNLHFSKNKPGILIITYEYRSGE